MDWKDARPLLFVVFCSLSFLPQQQRPGALVMKVLRGVKCGIASQWGVSRRSALHCHETPYAMGLICYRIGVAASFCCI